MTVLLLIIFVAWVQFPAAAEYFNRFSLADHTLPTRPEPAWQKMGLFPFNGTQRSCRLGRVRIVEACHTQGQYRHAGHPGHPGSVPPCRASRVSTAMQGIH